MFQAKLKVIYEKHMEIEFETFSPLPATMNHSPKTVLIPAVTRR